MALSVGSIPGDPFVSPCGPTTLLCLNAVDFPRPRDTQGGEGGVAKEKGRRREAGEDEDGSALPSPDVGLLRYIPPDQQGNGAEAN
jgi:hypothetical protein